MQTEHNKGFSHLGLEMYIEKKTIQLCTVGLSTAGEECGCM